MAKYQKYKSLHKHYLEHKSFEHYSVISIERLESFEAESFVDEVDNNTNIPPERPNLPERVGLQNVVEFPVQQEEKNDKTLR